MNQPTLFDLTLSDEAPVVATPDRLTVLNQLIEKAETDLQRWEEEKALTQRLTDLRARRDRVYQALVEKSELLDRYQDEQLNAQADQLASEFAQLESEIREAATQQQVLRAASSFVLARPAVAHLEAWRQERDQLTLSHEASVLTDKLTLSDEVPVVLPTYLEKYGTTPERCGCKGRKFRPWKPCSHMEKERLRLNWVEPELEPVEPVDGPDARGEAIPQLAHNLAVPGSACVFCGAGMVRHSQMPAVWRCQADDYHRFWTKQEGKAPVVGVWLGRSVTDAGSGVSDVPSWAQ